MRQYLCPHCPDTHHCPGLGEPVKPSTAGVHDFIQACCTAGPNLTIQAANLYKAYETWVHDERHTLSITQAAFGTAVKQMGFVARKSNLTYYYGINLTPSARLRLLPDTPS